MKILYICTGNSFRSPAAEALTKRHRPDLEAESAGTHPALEIAWNLEEPLAREGALQFLKSRPEQVSRKAVEEADLIVVMEEAHKDYLLERLGIGLEKIATWHVSDPIDPDVNLEEVLSKIKKKISMV